MLNKIKNNYYLLMGISIFCLIVIVLLFSLLLITLFPPLPESPLLVEVLVQQEYVG